MKKKYKVIIDTDPGVDDTNALVYALNDPRFEILLFTISQGNVDINNCARNMCHILDLFKKDIPVVKGYEKRLGNNTEDASFLHTKEGLGGYVPPKTTTHQLLKEDASDAIYKLLKKYPKEITLIVLGPHTNMAYLFRKYPDAKNLVKNILMMGGAPMGIKTNPNHNSFNIRTDAIAFNETVKTNVPTIMVPSSIGRDFGYFTEQQVEDIKKMGDLGKFLAKTFETYWEPNYPDRRIATNDLTAVYYLIYPRLYKIKKANIEVDLETGKTIPTFTKKGNFKIVIGLNRKKFQKIVLKKLEEMKDIKLDLYEAPAKTTKQSKKTATSKKLTKDSKSEKPKSIKNEKLTTNSSKATKSKNLAISKAENRTKTPKKQVDLKISEQKTSTKVPKTSKTTAQKTNKSTAQKPNKATPTTSKKKQANKKTTKKAN